MKTARWPQQEDRGGLPAQFFPEPETLVALLQANLPKKLKLDKSC